MISLTEYTSYMPNINRYITTTKNKQIDSGKYSILILASIPYEKMSYGPPVSLYQINAAQKLIDVQLEAISTCFPKSDIFMIAGHGISQIIPYKPKNLRVIENQKFEETGEVEELRLGLNSIVTESVITISANMIFNDITLNQVKTGHSSILVSSKIEEDGSVGTIVNTKSRLTNMGFGIPNKWCYISHFTGKELDILLNFVNTRSKANLCMFEAINSVINRHGLIYTVEHNNGLLKRIFK